jgi:hypothetical protein
MLLTAKQNLHVFVERPSFRWDFFQATALKPPSLQDTDCDIMLEVRQLYETIYFQWLAPQ